MPYIIRVGSYLRLCYARYDAQDPLCKCLLQCLMELPVKARKCLLNAISSMSPAASAFT
jgi:hypothetical protein